MAVCNSNAGMACGFDNSIDQFLWGYIPLLTATYEDQLILLRLETLGLTAASECSVDIIDRCRGNTHHDHSPCDHEDELVPSPHLQAGYQVLPALFCAGSPVFEHSSSRSLGWLACVALTFPMLFVVLAEVFSSWCALVPVEFVAVACGRG